MLRDDLPVELFINIIRDLAGTVGIKSFVKYRLVSAKFNSIIISEVLSTAASGCISELLKGNEATQQLFKYHAGDILAKAVLRRKTIPSPFLHFLKCIVATLVKRKGPQNTKREDQLRKDFANSISHAVTAFSPKVLQKRVSARTLRSLQTSDHLQHMLLAAIAAVGGRTLFLQSVTKVDTIFQRSVLFPSAIEAAVAADQKAMVETILKYIVSKVNTGTWDDMRAAAAGLYGALLVAIRLRRHSIAQRLVACLAKNKALGGSVLPKSRKLFHNTCIAYDNVRFYRRALAYMRVGEWEPLITGNLPDPVEDDVQLLLRRCSKWMLRRLINTKQLDANFVGQHNTVIFLALSVRRPELVKMLVDAGADINGQPRAGGGSVLYRAKRMGWEDDFKYLQVYHDAQFFKPSDESMPLYGSNGVALLC